MIFSEQKEINTEEEQPFTEAKKRLQELIDSKVEKRHLGEPGEIIFEEVGDQFWQLFEDYYSGKFETPDGKRDFVKRRDLLLRGKYSISELMIAGLIGNKLVFYEPEDE